MKTRVRNTEDKVKRMLWLDRVAEIDKKFNFEKFIDQALAAEVEHVNSDLFNRIFSLLDFLKEDKSIDS